MVATGTSGSDGSFAASFVIPATLPLGQCTITLTGTNILGKPQVLSIAINLVAVSAATSSSGGLAFTGQDSGTLLGIAAALMSLGAGLTIAARRRRQSRTTP